MKLTLITAALLAVAVAAPAQAKIDNGLQSPGNGELYLSIWDDNGTVNDLADDRSYTRDLGITVSQFASALATPVAVAPQPSFLFNADALLTSWLDVVSNQTSLHWNVAGFDGFGNNRAALTVSSNFTGSTQTYTEFRNWDQGSAAYLTAVNKLGDDTSVAINTSNTATSADGNAFAGGVAWGNKIGNRADFANDGSIGDSLDFWMFYETVSSGSTTTKVKQFEFANRAWTLSDGIKPIAGQVYAEGTLIYAPVPEPETYALMLAGLGLVGLVARRRKAA